MCEPPADRSAPGLASTASASPPHHSLASLAGRAPRRRAGHAVLVVETTVRLVDASSTAAAVADARRAELPRGSLGDEVAFLLCPVASATASARRRSTAALVHAVVQRTHAATCTASVLPHGQLRSSTASRASRITPTYGRRDHEYASCSAPQPHSFGAGAGIVGAACSAYVTTRHAGGWSRRRRQVRAVASARRPEDRPRAGRRGSRPGLRWRAASSTQSITGVVMCQARIER